MCNTERLAGGTLRDLHVNGAHGFELDLQAMMTKTPHLAHMAFQCQELRLVAVRDFSPSVLPLGTPYRMELSSRSGLSEDVRYCFEKLGFLVETGKFGGKVSKAAGTSRLLPRSFYGHGLQTGTSPIFKGLDCVCAYDAYCNHYLSLLEKVEKA